VGHHVRKGIRRFDNPVGMLVEHGEKIAFAWQQFGEQHRESFGIV
jgi:hypothetical protein